MTVLQSINITKTEYRAIQLLMELGLATIQAMENSETRSDEENGIYTAIEESDDKALNAVLDKIMQELPDEEGCLMGEPGKLEFALRNIVKQCEGLKVLKIRGWE